MDTNQQFEKAMEVCRDLFCEKLKNYGASWRIMRPSSVTDQIFIKAKRIRTLEINGHSKIDESSTSEWIGIVNYGIIALIQLDKECTDYVDISLEDAICLYEKYMQKTQILMKNKNYDYGEAWKDMRLQSYTDFVLTKIARIKQMEKNQKNTMLFEEIGANYIDIINYALFALIKIFVQYQ